MLTFLPGELSTIAGPLTDCNIDYCSFSTRAYNFRDLPCPPQSVMVSTRQSLTSLRRGYLAEMNVQEENWYKPQPGEPYRPLIAMPNQIRKLKPYYSRCTDNFFTGFDPPRTLAPAAALAPTTTTGDLKAFTTVPKPSPTPDAGAKKTANSEPPMITPADSPVVGELQKPDTQASDANHELSDTQDKADKSKPPKVYPAQPRPDPVEISSGHSYGNNANAVPGEKNNPTLPLIPVPTIEAGLTHGGSNQDTDPIVHSVPPPYGNADPAVGGPAESHDQGKPVAPQQIHNADGSVSGPGAKHPSEIDPLIGTTGGPKSYNLSKPSPFVNTGNNPAKENPNQPSQSAKAENGPRIESSSTPSQLAEHHPPESAQNHYGPPNKESLPGPFRTFGRGLQTENHPASQLSQILNVQPSSIDEYTITATPTAASHATFPSASLEVNTNGKLGTHSASANATETGAASNLDGKYITPGSGNRPIQPYTSSVNRYHTSVGSEVRIFRSKAWVALAISTILLWIG